MEDIESIFRNNYDKHILTEEQFNEMKSILFKPQAIKYIHSCTGIGLKASSCYYEFYHKENYNN